MIPFYTTSPQVLSNHTVLIYIMAGIHLLKCRFDRKTLQYFTNAWKE